MRKRPYGPAWALLPAAALFAWSSLVPVRPVAAQATLDLKPAASAESVPVTGSTVSILDAQRAGDLDVSIRGAGADHVKFTVKNKSDRRLNVVLPPGLVASAATAQGGGGFQSMGLGTLTDQPGRFGQFARGPVETAPGFRSVPADASIPAAAAPAARSTEGVGVGAGQTVEFNLPSVCLNFGAPTPTPTNVFSLVSVDEYTQDLRARKALRSLALLGTSQGVAQAVVWNVFNGMTAEQMIRQASKYLNAGEISVAARFIEALDASGSHDPVDAAAFREGRVLVRVRGEGNLGKVAARLNDELKGTQIFGLPVQVVTEGDAAQARPASVLLDVMLSGGENGKARGRVLVRTNSALSGWTRLGGVDLGGNLNLLAVTGESLADVLDRAVAAQFVTATPGRRGAGTVQFRIVNKLPLTLEDVVVRTGKDEDAALVTLEDLGVGPNRAALAPIRAAAGQVERVTFNGL